MVGIPNALRYDAYFGRFAVMDVAEERGDVRGVVNHEVIASSIPKLITAGRAPGIAATAAKDTARARLPR